MPVVITKNIDELSQQVAEWMVDYIRKTLLLQDRFTIALSGGGTPKKLHLLLASDQFKNKIDWQKLHVFWGDERYVPFNDDRNNAKMAFDTLLNSVPVPASQIHIMRTEIDAEESAKEYEDILKEYFPEAASYKLQAAGNNAAHHSPPDSYRDTTPSAADRVPPSALAAAQGLPLAQYDSRLTTFDLVLLGLGDNSHTLSLFPAEQVIHEKDHWVRSVFVKEINMQRITLTAPVVNLSKRIAFLVSGQDKAEAVAHILSGNYDPDRYPAQVIKPVYGELFWFLDEAAATRVNDSY